MKKGVIFIILMILLSLSVIGEPPFVQTSNDLPNTLEIIVPKPTAYKVNSNVTSGHIHVFNSTGSVIYPVAPNNCSVHIYNELNKHVLEQNLTADSNEVDWKITLTPSLFTTIGEYGYIIYCNTPTEKGFISSTFEVTETGHTNSAEYERSRTIQNYIILYIFSCLIVFYLVYKKGYQFVGTLMWLGFTLVLTQYYQNVIITTIIYVSAIITIITGLDALKRK